MKDKFLAEIIFAFETLDKRSKFLVVALILFFLASTLILLNKLNNKLMIDEPIAGGQLTEGILGTPRFVNPLLAVSDADRDLTMLVYSGLLRIKNDGSYELDLAKNYEVSADGLTYTFQLKDNLYWSDGEPFKVDDIIFTIKSAQDQAIKSVKRGSWNGITAIKVDEHTVKFELKKPYRAFFDNLTLGILPAHLWEKVKPEQFALSSLNINPIGTGPYVVKNVNKDSNDIPVSYDLAPFKKFALKTPKISSLSIRFYGDEKGLIAAYKRGEINSAGALNPADAKKLAQEKQRIIQASVPRVFAVFLNQSRNPILLNEEVRSALNQATDRKKIIDKILNGYGQPIDNIMSAEKGTETDYNLQQAKDTLAEAGWTIGEKGIWEKKAQSLSFVLTTANVSELKAVATTLKQDWEKLGAKVDLEFFEPGDLNQEVIRPRRYEALLFGQVIGRSWDLLPFWHSSQRFDPGLNIALYANKKVDKLLEEIRSIPVEKDISEKYQVLAKEISNDQPAIFLYSPSFIYLVPSELKGIKLTLMASNATRFSNIHEWYFKTDRVWKIFSFFY